MRDFLNDYFDYGKVPDYKLVLTDAKYMPKRSQRVKNKRRRKLWTAKK